MLKVLSKLFLLGSAASQAAAEAEDHLVMTIGLHLLSDYGSRYEFLTKDISPRSIKKELHKLNWENNFYQFILVKEPGVLMEVGGSLNPNDGLSAFYINQDTKTDGAIDDPPNSVQEMEGILNAFLAPEDTWKSKYIFNLVEHE